MTSDFWAKTFMLAAVLVSGLVALLVYEAIIRFAASVLLGIAGVAG